MPAQLDASLLTKTVVHTTRPVPDPEVNPVEAQRTCTDHMITAKWTAENGWEAPKLEPYGPFQMMPTCSVFHYAIECFEGLKCYRGYDGKIRLFRPLLNAKRMQTSAARVTLPSFDADALVKLIAELCATDCPKWLPKSRPGSFLYIRPTFISTNDELGVKCPTKALLYVIMTYFPKLDGPRKMPDGTECGMKLWAMKEAVRAWPGGFGNTKVGANYGPAMVGESEAKKKGSHQVLWLFGDKNEVTEAGASNFFMFWKNREGQVELVTPSLERALILEGITRRSVLDTAENYLQKGSGDLSPVKTVEKILTMDEILEASKEGRILEAFVTGTAYFIAPVGEIRFQDEVVTIPMSTLYGGPYTLFLKNTLSDIMFGKKEHEWAMVVEEHSE